MIATHFLAYLFAIAQILIRVFVEQIAMDIFFMDCFNEKKTHIKIWVIVTKAK